MRVAALIAALAIIAPSAIAQPAASPGLRQLIEARDTAALRTELTLQQWTRNEAGQEKSRAYRQAHELYKNCTRELRPFCMLSAQQIMRDADYRYKESEARGFPHIALIEKALAGIERASRGGEPPKAPGPVIIR